MALCFDWVNSVGKCKNLGMRALGFLPFLKMQHVLQLEYEFRPYHWIRWVIVYLHVPSATQLLGAASAVAENAPNSRILLLVIHKSVEHMQAACPKP